LYRLPYPSLGGVFLVAILASACIGVTPVVFDPTPTQAPTQTATLAPSPTPLPSATATLTASPAPTATQNPGTPTQTPLVLGKVESIPEAGFSFRSVEGFTIQQDSPEQVTLVSPDGGIILSMSSIAIPVKDPIEDLMRRLMTPIAELFESFKSSDPYAIEVDQKLGLASDLSGVYAGQNFNGQVLLVPSSDNRVFSALSILVELDVDPSTGSLGRQAIQAIIDSVDFIEPDE